jgi:hypothetical protein
MRFAMGIQSYFCCLTASRLPGNGIVERSSRSQCPHYAPGMKVPRIRKRLIVGTRSVRRASGLLETGFSVTCSCVAPPLGNLLKIRLYAHCAGGRSRRVRAVTMAARHFGTLPNITVSKAKRLLADFSPSGGRNESRYRTGPHTLSRFDSIIGANRPSGQARNTARI